MAGHVDEDVLQEVPETPDSGGARSRCFTEARSHLLDTQEALRRQLQAQVRCTSEFHTLCTDVPGSNGAAAAGAPCSLLML